MPILGLSLNLRNSTSVLPLRMRQLASCGFHWAARRGAVRQGPTSAPLANEHAVTVTVEAISGGDRVAVRGQYGITAREC